MLDWQLLLTLAVVALAAVYLAWRGWTAWRQSQRGCGGCGCGKAPETGGEQVKIVPSEELRVRRR
jgi:hypothetical protein